jgi:hypothetical protein
VLTPVPDLIVIFGPPAVGKAAVGYELAKLTTFRFFHNHMTAEPVAALFGWGTESFGKPTDQLRLTLFTEAITQSNMPSIIFTFVWALDLEGDCEFIKKVVALFEASGGKIFFVELVASLPARLEREGTPLRLSLKPSKRNVPSARALLVEFEGKYKLNSTNDFPYPEHHLVLNTEQCSSLECAQRIAAHWCFNDAST